MFTSETAGGPGVIQASGLCCVLLTLSGLLFGCDPSASADGPTTLGPAQAGGSAAPEAGLGTATSKDAGPIASGPIASGSAPPMSGGAGPAARDAGLEGADAGVISASGQDAAAGSVAPTTGPFPPVSDFTKDGPYTAQVVKNTGPNSGYTLYRPDPLAPSGAKNPIVAWMSGGGTFPELYLLLPRLATHGFVVVASNTIPGIGDEVALGQELLAAIDWATAENERTGSELYEKLDATKVAAIGYSMGSLATFTIAADPRLTTTLHISGGNMKPERIENLRAPAAFICGTPGPSSCGILDTNCDIAATNCDVDFMSATTPVFYANFPGGHLGILTPPLDAAIGAMATAWLRYQLMSDSSLAKMFVGDACTYCTDPNWKVQQKNLK